MTVTAVEKNKPAVKHECGFIIDASKRNDEVVCGDDAVAEVLVKNDFGLFNVLLCKVHKEQHRRFYAKRDRVNARPRRHN